MKDNIAFNMNIQEIENTQSRYSLSAPAYSRLYNDYLRFYEIIPKELTNNYISTIIYNYLSYCRDNNSDNFEKEIEIALESPSDKSIEKVDPSPNRYVFTKKITNFLKSFSFYKMITSDRGNKRKLIEYLLECYLKLPLNDREKIFFYENYCIITSGISDRNILRIDIKDAYGELITVDYQPYILQADDNSSFHYLLGISSNINADINQKGIFSTRLQRIKSVINTKRKFEYSISTNIEIQKRISRLGVAYIGNCDEPKIKVALTSKGYSMYLNIINHQRPLPIDTYKYNAKYPYLLVFSCSVYQIKNYFIQFGSEALIVEPLSLKDEFENFYQEAARCYNF